ncbi:MAG: PilZ domain-containing protein [Halobacteriovoraceae bacterium]|jgi:hypothetical protein|nr:PilZ domain-containing protein [Halobacteriovoraceae bacterium]MBT5095261.1 PilZ domain-containing protein [Halobacteriovoraceae bacterium]
MQLRDFNLKLKQDFDRVDVLHWGHFVFLILACLFELIHGGGFFLGLFKITALLFFYRLYFKTKAQLYYSFWTFSFLLILFLLQKILATDISSVATLCTFSLIILAVEMYILSSPIYYPRVSWWEYDFRFRHDLKIKVTCDGEEYEGRLTDLRREAGCVNLFEEKEVGTQFLISLEGEHSNDTYTTEVMSKRRYSLGRPLNYGVRFIFKDNQAKNDFNRFCKFFHSERKDKRKLKLSKGNT